MTTDTSQTAPSQRIIKPFPRPPTIVARMLEDLATARQLAQQVAQGGPDGDLALQRLTERGDLDTLPRPWDPATCPASTRLALWQWLDDSVTWLNHEHAWALSRTIPACWPDHPHLAHEVAVLITLRWQAHLALTPDALEDWYRWALPMFTDRMTHQIGANACPPGKHQDWPGRQRHAAHDELAAQRRTRFDRDSQLD